MSDLLAKCDWNGDELRVELPQWPEVVTVWVNGKAEPFVPVTDPDALGVIKCLQGLAVATSAENAKLRDENARLRSCLSDDAENARMIMGENAKLHELLTDLAVCACGKYCYGCPHQYDGCDRDERLRELGVEVES